jgi:serine/threonine protein kinase/tetratricopeptide (TPR) repeat protein
MAPAVGMRFGRYELLERLGAGGMGEVFRARDQDLQRDVAIKFLPERFASDADRLARFAQEARAASSLNHPNIVTIHEIGQTSGLPYIVMEFVDGQTLRRFVRDRPLPPRRTLDIAVQLADGLAKAHAAGIVHRDLKPENVMVTRDGFAKILDFGLAKLRADEPAKKPEQEDVETQLSPDTVAGLILGTAGYMSPEQARGEPADHRSDQFALGAVLYELATGRKAFRRDSVVQTLTAVIEHTPEPIARLNPDFPAPARWAIERCLEKEKESRYASTLDLARELRSVREHLTETGSGTSDVAPSPSPRRCVKPWHVLVVATTIILAVLVTTRVKSVRSWLWHAPLPSEMRVAVLPVSVAGIGEQDTTCCAGLLEYVAVRLADLSRFQGRVSVVPVAELLSAGVNSPSAAGRALGATIAVSISVHRARDSLVVSVSLADAEKVRQLTGESKTFRLSSFSPEDVVNLVLPLLELQLAASEKTAWNLGSSGVAEAGVLYAQGLGQTPYRQAQSRLEQYDQARSLEQAIKLFNEAVNLDPRYAAAHAALGEARVRLYRLTRNPEDLALAEQSVKQALALDDTRPGAWMTLGMIRVQRGDAAQAEKAFSEAIARNPNGADTYRELGLAYQRGRLWDKAETAYKKAIQLQPKSWSNHNYLGSFFYNRQRYPEAEAEFRRTLELVPENARVWSNLGGVYLAEERWNEAESALTAALRSYRYGPALSNLGYLKYWQRQYAEAARISEQAIEATPRDPRAWQNLAVASYRAGQRERAGEAYRQAASLLEEERRIDPTNAEVLISLADCYAMLGDGERARPLVAEALKRGIAPDNWADVAGVFEELGDREEAIRQLRAALKAGVRPEEFERDPTFDDLRKDPRYAALVKPFAGKKDSSVR